MATKITLANKPVVGQKVVMGVTTDVVGAYRFQWLKNGAYIAGAPGDKSYLTPTLNPIDFEAKFTVLVTGQDGRAEISDPMVFMTELEPPPSKEVKEKEDNVGIV